MSTRCNPLGFVAHVVLVSAALALGGCVANDISLSINEFVGADASMAATGICEIDSTSIAITRGVYDATLAQALDTGYSANFSVTNNLETVTTEDIELQAYYISSFDVEIIPEGASTGGAHAAIPSSMRQFNYSVGSQRLAPGETAFFSVQAIPASDAAAFVAEGGGSIEVRVRPVATRAEEQQTGAYTSFPVDICLGCLTGTTNYPACSTLPTSFVPLIGNVCNYAQDAAVTCCTKSGTLICGSNVKLATM
jgi:hypothetical protein